MIERITNNGVFFRVWFRVNHARAHSHLSKDSSFMALIVIVIYVSQNLNLSRLEKIHDVALLGSPIILSLPPSWHWFCTISICTKVPNFFFLRVAP